MKRSVFDLLLEQVVSKPPAVEKADLRDKTVVVVGANTGIGYEATKHFALMGPARLILGCRSKERGEEALNRLSTETGYTSAELWLVDLAKFESVSSFANRFDEAALRLDILVLNAAVINPKYEATSDGWEACLQVNNISSPLLAFRLLPHMFRTANEFHTTPRLVTVASDVHYMAKVEREIVNSSALLETLSDEAYCTPKYMTSDRYNFCKLLNVLFARALADHLAHLSVMSISANPGLCASELRRNVTEGSKILAFAEWLLVKVFGYTGEEGSRQLVYAAVGGEDLNGQYIERSKITEPSDFVIGNDGKILQEQYWKELILVLGKVDDKVPKIVAEYLK